VRFYVSKPNVYLLKFIPNSESADRRLTPPVNLRRPWARVDKESQDKMKNAIAKSFGSGVKAEAGRMPPIMSCLHRHSSHGASSYYSIHERDGGS